MREVDSLATNNHVDIEGKPRRDESHPKKDKGADRHCPAPVGRQRALHDEAKRNGKPRES